MEQKKFIMFIIYNQTPGAHLYAIKGTTWKSGEQFHTLFKEGLIPVPVVPLNLWLGNCNSFAVEMEKYIAEPQWSP